MQPAHAAAKFRELVLYLAAASIDDPIFGQTKPAKLLFFADFRAYATLAGPITGSAYERWDHGPFPSQLYAVERDLEDRGDAFLAERYFHAFRQERLIARRKPDLGQFSAEFWGRDAASVEWQAHQHPGWKAAADREQIPYNTAFLSDDKPSADDVAFVQAFAREQPVLARVAA